MTFRGAPPIVPIMATAGAITVALVTDIEPAIVIVEAWLLVVIAWVALRVTPLGLLRTY